MGDDEKTWAEEERQTALRDTEGRKWVPRCLRGCGNHVMWSEYFCSKECAASHAEAELEFFRPVWNSNLQQWRFERREDVG